MEKINNFNDFEKIFVLVSGGIDSTYLYEHFKKVYKEKVYPVNCFNPYEQSETLTQISKDKNFIQILPELKNSNYQDILKNAFLKISFAVNRLKKLGKYDKKTAFKCCYLIKHRAFIKNIIFKQPNSIVISGIKAGDGKQRRIFLSQMRIGSFKSLLDKKPNFILRHKNSDILYCYPFRDYTFKEFPNITLKRLRKTYPSLKHSGCYICPVLVMFDLKFEGNRYIQSVKYAEKLGVNINKKGQIINV